MNTQTSMSNETTRQASNGGGSKATTTRKVARKAHDAVETAAAKSEPLERELRNKATQAGRKLERGQEALMDGIHDSVEGVERFARTRPLAAAGIAFAAGVLASSLLRR